MSFRQPRTGLVLAAALALLAAGCSGCGCRSQTPPVKKPTGEPWEGTLNVETGDWSRLKALIDSHKGKVVIVHFWFTENKPSTRDLPRLAKLQKEHGSDVACIVASCDFGLKPKESVQDVRQRVANILRKRFGKVLLKSEALKPTVTLFVADVPTDDFYADAEIEGPPTILVYGKTGKRTMIDFDSVQPPPPEATKTDPNPKPEIVPVSYEKHVVPVVEKLLKE